MCTRRDVLFEREIVCVHHGGSVHGRIHAKDRFQDSTNVRHRLTAIVRLVAALKWGGVMVYLHGLAKYVCRKEKDVCVDSLLQPPTNIVRKTVAAKCR